MEGGTEGKIHVMCTVVYTPLMYMYVLHVHNHTCAGQFGG